MKVGLFIPCYVDQFYPDIALATYNLLKKLEVDVEYPMEQTCCGQPLYNSGCFKECESIANKFIRTFKKYDYIVAPSGSCIAMVKNNYKKLDKDGDLVFDKSYELVEFIHDILKVKDLSVSFDSKVGLHNSCHAHRELGLASSSELNCKPFSKIENLLDLVDGLEYILPKRPDECCGFGGTFSLNEPEVSTQMGNDKLQDFMDFGVEYITGVDISCLMHLQGLIDRQKLPIKTIHISQLLMGEKL